MGVLGPWWCLGLTEPAVRTVDPSQVAEPTCPRPSLVIDQQVKGLQKQNLRGLCEVGQVPRTSFLQITK